MFEQNTYFSACTTLRLHLSLRVIIRIQILDDTFVLCYSIQKVFILIDALPNFTDTTI